MKSLIRGLPFAEMSNYVCFPCCFSRDSISVLNSFFPRGLKQMEGVVALETGILVFSWGYSFGSLCESEESP